MKCRKASKRLQPIMRLKVATALALRGKLQQSHIQRRSQMDEWHAKVWRDNIIFTFVATTSRLQCLADTQHHSSTLSLWLCTAHAKTFHNVGTITMCFCFQLALFFYWKEHPERGEAIQTKYAVVMKHSTSLKCTYEQHMNMWVRTYGQTHFFRTRTPTRGLQPVFWVWTIQHMMVPRSWRPAQTIWK